MASIGAAIFHLVVVGFLLTGLYDVLLNYEENECEMSYMYETPQYKQVPMGNEIAAKYPRYGLHLYGEGHYFKVSSDLKLSGMPVLYIPGNGGSMKQCRSVASFLLRKAEQRQWDPHFNVFTVDLNEELVAFYGGTLNEQTEFVHHSIKAILKLYEDSSILQQKPKSVVLVGHSMGGMVARGVFALPDFDPKTVQVVYTLATPHAHPIFSFDAHIAGFYHSVNSYWNEVCEDLKDVMLVSVSGGDRDFQVDGAVTRLPLCSNHSIATASTAIPRAWVSADHQCAVWCKQVVLAITRSMFDMVDSKTRQISLDATLRSKVLRHHFVRNSGVSKFLDVEERSKVKLFESLEIISVSETVWSSEEREEGESAAYVFFDLASLQERGKVFAVAKSSATSQRWVFACDNQRCKRPTDLSAEAYLTPSFKVVKLNVTDLIQDGFLQLILKVPKKGKSSGEMEINFLNSEELQHEYLVPQIFSNLWTLNKGYILENTLEKGRFYHRITLSGLHSIFHSYKILLSPLTVSETAGQPLLEVEYPSHPGHTYTSGKDVTVKLRGTAGAEVPILHVYTNGKSEYTVTVKVQFVQILGQILRFESMALPAMIALNGMLAFSYQLKMLLAGKACLTTQAAHGISAKPYKVQPFINLVKKLYTYEWFFLAWHATGLPVPDAVRIDDDFKVWFALMPLVTFLYGMEIFSLLLWVETNLVRLTGMLFARFLMPKSQEDLRPSLLFSTVHTVILALLVSQSASLAFVYIAFLNFVDLTTYSMVLSESKEKRPKACENGKPKALDDTTDDEDDDEAKSSSEKTLADKEEVLEQDPVATTFHLKLSMQMLWLCLVGLALPSVTALVKGFSSPARDPNLISAIVGSLLFLLHRQQDAAVQSSTLRKALCRFMYPMTILASMLCLFSMHRLPFYILSFQSIYVAMQYFE